jgi:hypothetical protein
MKYLRRLLADPSVGKEVIIPEPAGGNCQNCQKGDQSDQEGLSSVLSVPRGGHSQNQEGASGSFGSAPAPIAEKLRSRPDAAEDPLGMSDNRRTCRNCAHLVGGYCRAQSTSRRPWRPIQDLPQRCEYYSPNDDDPDRRSASVRWALATRDGL